MIIIVFNNYTIFYVMGNYITKLIFKIFSNSNLNLVKHFNLLLQVADPKIMRTKHCLRHTSKFSYREKQIEDKN